MVPGATHADCGTKPLFPLQSCILFSDMAAKTCYTSQLSKSQSSSNCLHLAAVQMRGSAWCKAQNAAYRAAARKVSQLLQTGQPKVLLEQVRSPAAQLSGPTRIWEVPQSIQTNTCSPSSLVSRVEKVSFSRKG